MELDQLRAFQAVVETGSFSRAAAAVHRSQSTVSFQIRALEAALKTQLLDRTGGRVRLTASGRLVLAYARRILALDREARERVTAGESGQSGTVTIASSTVPAEVLLPPLLSRFRMLCPRVEVRVEVSDSQKALARLKDHACDLAVVGCRVPDRRLAFTAFASDDIVLVGPAHGPWSHQGRERDPLAQLPLVLREEGSGTGAAVASLVARRSRAAGTRPANIHAGSNEMARRCVLAGLGVTFISRLAVDEDLRAGRLRILPCPGTPLRRTFHVARLKGATLPATARRFLEVLQPARA